eukprot:scaffold1170_cov122-Cylindrotheca_fusiformis.AAC.12
MTGCVWLGSIEYLWVADSKLAGLHCVPLGGRFYPREHHSFSPMTSLLSLFGDDVRNGVRKPTVYRHNGSLGLIIVAM